MSDADSPPRLPDGEPGVLGRLPNSRPQHAITRRAAARAAVQQQNAKRQKSTGRKQETKKQKAGKRRPQTPKAPRQGFESDGDLAAGTPVQPPSSSEIVASVLDVFGEIAQNGLSGGGRVVKDALARLLGGS
jgi:hypothetical protein